MDLVKAAQMLLASHPELKLHLLFAGSGELGAELRAACNVVFDAESPSSQLPAPSFKKPPASFSGFLNQTEVSRAYVAADCLVLPSDYNETWGLVVNEAMASGLPCIISDRCGCAPDLGKYQGNSVFPFSNVEELAKKLANLFTIRQTVGQPPSLHETVEVVAELYANTVNPAAMIQK